MRYQMMIGAVVATAAGAASAIDVPFVETFDTGPADWFDAAGGAPVGWSATGGIGDSGHATTTFNFVNSSDGDTPTLFRAQDEFGSSGGAFEGNWIDAGITGLSFSFRHFANEPVSAFVRFSSPFNFPGAIAVSFVPAAPGVWQDVFIPIAPDGPNFVSFEGSDFETVFSNIGHVQIGVNVSSTLAGTDADFRFDIDNVAIVPTPATAGLLAVGGLAAARRRR